MSETKRIRGGALLARALREKWNMSSPYPEASAILPRRIHGMSDEVINCPHEQIAGHFADGHTRITRKPAVCLVGQRICQCRSCNDGGMG